MQEVQRTLSDEKKKEEVIKGLSDLNFMKKKNRRNKSAPSTVDDVKQGVKKECDCQTAPLGASPNSARRDYSNHSNVFHSGGLEKNLPSFQLDKNKLNKPRRHSDLENTPPSEFQVPETANSGVRQTGPLQNKILPKNDQRGTFSIASSFKTMATESGRNVPKEDTVVQRNLTTENGPPKRVSHVRHNINRASAKSKEAQSVSNAVSVSMNNDPTRLHGVENDSLVQHSPTEAKSDSRNVFIFPGADSNNNKTDIAQCANSSFSIETSTLNPNVPSFVPFPGTSLDAVQMTSQSSPVYLAYSGQLPIQCVATNRSGNPNTFQQLPRQIMTTNPQVSKQDVASTNVIGEAPKKEKRRSQIGYSLNRRRPKEDESKSTNSASNSHANLDIDVLKTLNKMDAMRLNSLRSTPYRINEADMSANSLSVNGTLSNDVGAQLQANIPPLIDGSVLPADNLPVDVFNNSDGVPVKATSQNNGNIPSAPSVNGLPANDVFGNGAGAQVVLSVPHRIDDAAPLTNNLAVNYAFCDGGPVTVTTEVGRTYTEPEATVQPFIDPANVTAHVGNEEQNYLQQSHGLDQLENGLQTSSGSSGPLWYRMSDGSYQPAVIPQIEFLNECKRDRKLSEVKVEESNSWPNIQPAIYSSAQQQGSPPTLNRSQYTENDSCWTQPNISNTSEVRELASSTTPRHVPKQFCYGNSESTGMNVQNSLISSKGTGRHLLHPETVSQTVSVNRPAETALPLPSAKGQVMQSSNAPVIPFLGVAAECKQYACSSGNHETPMTTKSQPFLKDLKRFASQKSHSSSTQPPLRKTAVSMNAPPYDAYAKRMQPFSATETDSVQSPHYVSRFPQASTNGGLGLRPPIGIPLRAPVDDGNDAEPSYIQRTQHRAAAAPPYSQYSQQPGYDNRMGFSRPPPGFQFQPLPEAPAVGILKHTELMEHRIGFSSAAVHEASPERQAVKRVTFATESELT